MALELVPAEPKHINEIGRICFEAFKSIHDKHVFPRDFPDVELAIKVVGMLVERKDFYGVVALLEGKPVGSNFSSLMDEVSGIGPITVDPACQTRGIGRALMEGVVNYAKRNNIEKIRLLQDSFNMASLSLYTSLGFDVKETVVLMEAVPASKADQTVRSITENDLAVIEGLSRRIYKVSRINEVASAFVYGFPAFLRERDGRVTGYLLPGFFGHGVAETEEDALALIGESARRIPPEFARFFCPLRQEKFFRTALRNGCRAIKVMNLMAVGPYEPPQDVWMPSILY
ncbi:MAG TPA: GNAT family N-acetyltransferase [Thermodesulfobacteriota bacterium]|nr:GNAT family N-acetyltransferase [Thermodesulfobacteriota bacterium]